MLLQNLKFNPVSELNSHPQVVLHNPIHTTVLSREATPEKMSFSELPPISQAPF